MVSMYVDRYGDTWFQLGENAWIYPLGVPRYFDEKMLKIEDDAELTLISKGEHLNETTWSYATPWNYTITNGNYAQGTTEDPFVVSPGSKQQIVGVSVMNGFFLLQTVDGYFIEINGEFGMTGGSTNLSTLNNLADVKTDFTSLVDYDLEIAPEDFYCWVSPGQWGTVPMSLPSYSNGHKYNYCLNAGDVFKVSRIANSDDEVGTWFEIGENVWVCDGGYDIFLQAEPEYEELPQPLEPIDKLANSDAAIFKPINYSFVLGLPGDEIYTWKNFSAVDGFADTIEGGTTVNVVEIRYTDEGKVWYQLDSGQWICNISKDPGFGERLTIGFQAAVRMGEVATQMGENLAAIVETINSMVVAVTNINNIIDEVNTSIVSVNAGITKMTQTVDDINATLTSMSAELTVAKQAVKKITGVLANMNTALDNTNDTLIASSNDVDLANQSVANMIEVLNETNSGVAELNQGVSQFLSDIKSVNKSVEEMDGGLEEALAAVNNINVIVASQLQSQRDWTNQILKSTDDESYELMQLLAEDAPFNRSLADNLSNLKLDLTDSDTTLFDSSADIDISPNGENLIALAQYAGSVIGYAKGTTDIIVGVLGIAASSGGDVFLSLASGGVLAVPASELAVAIDAASAELIAEGVGTIAATYTVEHFAKKGSYSGTQKASVTVGGRPIRATVAGKKRVLRVDYEPMSNKIQIQDNRDKLYDIRIKYSKITKDDSSIFDQLTPALQNNKTVAKEIIKRVRKAVYYIENN